MICDHSVDGQPNMRQIYRPLILSLALILLASVSAAQGSANEETSNSKSAEGTSPTTYHLTFTGLIRLVGNEPFTRLVITTEKGIDYIIEDAYRAQYHDLQGTWVEATGVVREEEVYAGRDKLIGIERWFVPEKVEPLAGDTPKT